MKSRTFLRTTQSKNKGLSFAIIFLVHSLLLGAMTASAKIVVLSTEYVKTNHQDRKRVLSDSQIKEIETDLRAKTGLGSVAFNENGELTYDRFETVQGGSRKMRRAIVGAISDTRNIFEIGNYSRSKEIQFAVTHRGTMDFETRVTVYRVRIDFGDFKNSKLFTPKEVLRSYTVGITLFHEIDHKVSYDPDDPLPPSGIRPDKSSNGVRGVIENTNVVRRELSLMLRRSTQHRGELYKGVVASYRNTYQIGFVNSSGKRKNLRWKLEKR